MNRPWHRSGAWLHRWLGATVSVVLLALAVSGLLLMHPDWTGPAADRTLSLVVDPEDADHLLRGTERGLLRSEDGGATWQRLEPATPIAEVVSLEWAPDDPDLVYAASRDGDLLRSHDGGWSWEAVGRDGLPPRGTERSVFAWGVDGLLRDIFDFDHAPGLGGLHVGKTG